MTRSEAPAADGLDAVLAEARTDSAEFPYLLANHAPMILVALDRLGASEARLRGFLAQYRAVNGLVPPPPPLGSITQENWRAARGDRTRETDLRTFFMGEVLRDGIGPVMAAALPELLPGIGASALHGLMRLAYGAMRRDAAEVGTALGYWAATFLPLPPAGAEPRGNLDPGHVLSRIADLAALRDIVPETDLLWHNIKAVAAVPAFAPVVDWLRIDAGTPERIAQTSLALFAGTMDFTALHALTGMHWLRLILPYCPVPALALRHFWQVIAALVPKLGFPALPTLEALDAWRHLPCPAWPQIASAAIASNDEHDISLVFSAREEDMHYGDRLYRVVAARRMNLIP